MQWTKLKKTAEKLICDSLKGRIEYHNTSYNNTHDHTGRCWITFDKEEIFNACYLKYETSLNNLASEIRSVNRCAVYHDSQQAKGYYQALTDAERIMENRGIHSQYEFIRALEQYINITINDALHSENKIIKALSIIDRRLGKRRIKEILIPNGEHPLVEKLYMLRYESEKFEPTTGHKKNFRGIKGFSHF